MYTYYIMFYISFFLYWSGNFVCDTMKVLLEESIYSTKSDISNKYIKDLTYVLVAISEQQQVATEFPGVSSPGGNSLMDQSFLNKCLRL